MRSAWRQALTLLAAATLPVALAAAPATGDIVYLYDDLGRLVRVIRADGEAASYHYDAVGNILQITRESGVAQATVVSGTSRPSGEQGSTVPLRISGTNLVGASVVCATPGVAVQDVRTDFDQISLELVIAQSAPSGPVQCEILGVTTATLPFSIVRTIPVLLGAPSVTVQVVPALAPVVTAGVSVRVAEPALVVDRSVLGATTVQVEAAGGEIATGAVSVAVQPVITSVSPATGARATPSLAVRLLGAGLDGATAVTFLLDNTPDLDITVVTFSATPDGTEVDLQIAIAAGAAVGARVIRITTPSGSSTPGGTGGNLFPVQ